MMTDIPMGDWIDRRLPAGFRPYLRLMRLDRPIGTWLLLWPCWWSLALAGGGAPDLRLMALFGIGAVLMRGAGCVFNDIVDRDIDALVARTRTRPIASGAVGVKAAVLFMLALMGLSFLILLTFNRFAMIVGAAALILVFTYPFMKRVTYWPQAFLGLTFNWGALLGWAAATGGLGAPALLLYLAGLPWTLGYDTIYAHQDREDDSLIGVKSTALRLGSASRAWVAAFYALTILCLAAAGRLAGFGTAYLIGLAVAALQLAWQVATLDIDDPANCLTRFRSNRWFGWIVFMSLLIDGLLRR